MYKLYMVNSHSKPIKYLFYCKKQTKLTKSLFLLMDRNTCLFIMKKEIQKYLMLM